MESTRAVAAADYLELSIISHGNGASSFSVLVAFPEEDDLLLLGVSSTLAHVLS